MQLFVVFVFVFAFLGSGFAFWIILLTTSKLQLPGNGARVWLDSGGNLCTVEPVDFHFPFLSGLLGLGKQEAALQGYPKFRFIKMQPSRLLLGAFQLLTSSGVWAKAGSLRFAPSPDFAEEGETFLPGLGIVCGNPGRWEPRQCICISVWYVFSCKCTRAVWMGNCLEGSGQQRNSSEVSLEALSSHGHGRGHFARRGCLGPRTAASDPLSSYRWCLLLPATLLPHLGTSN